ncbi:hypothetical protein STEG23_035857 [Scotinomys teguina]
MKSVVVGVFCGTKPVPLWLGSENEEGTKFIPNIPSGAQPQGAENSRKAPLLGTPPGLNGVEIKSDTQTSGDPFTAGE